MNVFLWKVENDQNGTSVHWEHSCLLGRVYYRTDVNQYQMEWESDVLDKAIQDLNCSARTATCGSWTPDFLGRTWEQLQAFIGHWKIPAKCSVPFVEHSAHCLVDPQNDGAGNVGLCLDSAWEHLLDANFAVMFKYAQSSSHDFSCGLNINSAGIKNIKFCKTL